MSENQFSKVPFEPFYDKDGITIYCGDCRDILPKLPTADLILCDPPYGISNDNANDSRGRGCRPYDKVQRARDFAPVIGDDKPFDPRPFLLSPNVVLWGANHYADKLPPSSFWLCWDRKCEKAAGSDITDCELAWTCGTHYRTVRMFRHMWAGFQRDSQSGERHKHPMEKPVALMTWCINWFPKCRSILDPFMGSGTTLVAAKLAGRQATGIEISREYCEIAVRRLAQKVFNFEDA